MESYHAGLWEALKANMLIFFGFIKVWRPRSPQTALQQAVELGLEDLDLDLGFVALSR